jgi:hypothetical protein
MRSILIHTLIIFFALALSAAQPWTRHTIDNTSLNISSFHLADVNHDGLIDCVAAWGQGEVRGYLNPGKDKVNESWPSVVIGQVPSPEAAVFADINGDGTLDVVSCCGGKIQTMYFHWAPKDPAKHLQGLAWKSDAITASEHLMKWNTCAPLQVDGKNGTDLITLGRGTDNPLGWLECPDSPKWIDKWKWHPFQKIQDQIKSLLLVDMDEDGDMDLLTSQTKHGAVWYQNPGPKGKPTDTWKEMSIGKTDNEMMHLTTGDLDGDGIVDVVAATLSAFNKSKGTSLRPGPLVYFRKKSKNFDMWEKTEIKLPDQAKEEGKHVAMGDLDLDGKVDLVAGTSSTSTGQSGIWWLRYTKSPTDPEWEAQDISGQDGTNFGRIELSDVDGDGDLDVVTCERMDNLGVIWYENPTKSPANTSNADQSKTEAPLSETKSNTSPATEQPKSE